MEMRLTCWGVEEGRKEGRREEGRKKGRNKEGRKEGIAGG
jgi:hypothetical protein